MIRITPALGLIPVILSSGVGPEPQRPLTTVVGGLFSTTLLTLIVRALFIGIFSRSIIKRAVDQKG